MEFDTSTRPEEASRRAAYRGAGRPPWRYRFAWRAGEVGAAISDALESELAQRAGLHWLAVVFCIGCFSYFILPREPMLSALAAATSVATGLAALGYTRGTVWRLAAIVAMLAAGATAAKLCTDLRDAPHIAYERYAELSGRVVAREDREERRPRIVLDQIAWTIPVATDMPRRIRLTLAEKHGLPPLGSRIAVRARVMPVSGPVVPGGYDPRRAAYFDGIGGSGFVLGQWLTLDAPIGVSDLLIARVRSAIVARIMAAEAGDAGAVAAALLVGERSALSEETNESLRISGLAHILSISGLHMMLIAGATFFLVRAGLALSPRLALTWPIRKWSAGAALVVVTIYLTLSGGGSATVRAYVMAAIMFAAILVDRPAISMRNLAIAAFVVLALEPESIVEPGFQMSFCAVMALIAAWEAWRDRPAALAMDDAALPGARALRYLWKAVLGIALTTLVAGLSTAPFAAYHFERVATFSLLGNLLAAPLVSLVIMPFGLLTLVLMPLGLEALPLWVMARGIETLLAVSDWVAHLPGAEVRAPPIAPLALLPIVAGMIWLCLWRRRWRLLGLPAIGLGLLLIPFLVDRADILIAADGTAVAVRDSGGTLRVSGSRAGSYVVEQFFDEEAMAAAPGSELRQGVRCDELACVLTATGNLAVAHVLDAAAFAEDCRRADIVLTPLVAPADCRALLIIDAARFEQFGAHAVRIGGRADAIKFEVTTERAAFPRPWQEGAVAAN